MEELMQSSVQSLREGEVVRGTIVAVTSDEVMVDIGFKSEGTVPIGEFIDEETGEVSVKVNDEIEVLIERIDEMEGQLRLSRDRAAKLKTWRDIEEAYKGGSSVTGRVLERVKGGLSVDIGIRAFLPGSLVDLRPNRRLEDYIDTEVEAKIIAFDRRRSNVVLSHLDLNASIRRMEKRLLADLGPDHSLELHLASEVPRVSAPLHLFVQVLLGLVANAVETLPEGGALEIATGLLEAGESGSRARRYATVVVRTRAGVIEGARLIDLMEEAPARREDALTFRRLRRLLARMDGDHSVHCDPGGGVVLTAYLPEAP